VGGARKIRRDLNKDVWEVEKAAGEQVSYYPVTATVSGGVSGGWERA